MDKDYPENWAVIFSFGLNDSSVQNFGVSNDCRMSSSIFPQDRDCDTVWFVSRWKSPYMNPADYTIHVIAESMHTDSVVITTGTFHKVV